MTYLMMLAPGNNLKKILPTKTAVPGRAAVPGFLRAGPIPNCIGARGFRLLRKKAVEGYG